MSFSVQYSDTALFDLDQIWTGVLEASADFDTADNYIQNLQNAIKDKNAFPYSGAPLNFNGGFTGYYYVVYKAYIAFYVVRDDTLLVSRILPWKSNYIQTLLGHDGMSADSWSDS